MENQYVVVDARTPQTGARPAKSKSRVFLTPDERNQAIVRLAVISCVVTYTGSYTWLTLSEKSVLAKDYFQFCNSLCWLESFLITLGLHASSVPLALKPSAHTHTALCVYLAI